MRQFFKFVFATIFGIALFLFLVIILVVALVPEAEGIKENSVLKINLDKMLVERQSGGLWRSIKPSFTGEEGTIGLLELREAIKKAKDDSKIKGIVLDLRQINAGFASLEELRNALIDFKKSGKFVVAYSETYSEGNYYLASVADKIYLPESGMVELNGLGVELLFFKGTLEKLDIKPEIFPVGKFKSAVEPFRFEEMSEANRTQVRSFLNSIYGHYIAKVAAARGIDPEKLKAISDSMLVRTGKDAHHYKLVTDLGYYDQAVDFMKGKLNVKEDEELNVVSLGKYQNAASTMEEQTSANKIAVIFASGNIEQGKANTENIGSESLASELRKARLDEEVKAVVLRINSPGGSALASDIIWREVILLSKKKPIIASMSDVAASGGYYIAMACDTIVAQPNTITGSIGVFGILFNGKDFLKNKLGITSDREKTGPFADIGTFTRDMTPYERQAIQSEVERIYLDFKKKVAQGRGMDTATVEKYAQGRVWTGLEAKTNGLIDIHGGMEDAILLAARKAKVEGDYQLQYLPEIKTIPFVDLFSQMDDDEAYLANNRELEQLYPYLKTLLELKKIQGIQARMPFEIIVK